ncbi:hypothetical protein [Metabacillus fastidiosus]|uniref:HNH endonuclease n=1 Tax=Metabacillus fastidiosus TaxID=1458 RepID=A0ABU6P302_9BACI|nr:hypothetical protein [Metabacillus fastidiosus]
MNHFKNYKLKIEWKPGQFHGKTIRKNLSQTLWLKKIRPQILKKFNYTCQICSFHPEEEKDYRLLHVHEIEEYDTENLICNLKGLDLICINCHSFHHFGRTVSVTTKEQMEKLKEHFKKVNNCTEDDFIEHYRYVRDQKMKIFNDMLNNTKSYNQSRNNNTVKFRITGQIPFKEEVIKQLQKKDLYI